jgi:HEAT repeat protein
MRKVIHFNSKDQLLSKVKAYTDSVDLMMEEPEVAIPLLSRGFKYAPRDLKYKIILLMGSFAKDEVAWTLYRIMNDQDEKEEIRHAASVQLSVTLSLLDQQQPFVDKLINDIKSVDPTIKRLAAFALGWEGNAQAAIPLIDLLYDADIDVQQTAVNALANLRDDRILNLLLERLAHGPLDQKRAILYNLWRFYSRQDEVVAVYLEYLEHPDEDLRFDALVLLGPVTDTEALLDTYERCLQDVNPRVRRLALERLLEVSSDQLKALEQSVQGLITDPDPKTKRLAIQCVHKLTHGEHHQT